MFEFSDNFANKVEFAYKVHGPVRLYVLDGAADHNGSAWSTAVCSAG